MNSYRITLLTPLFSKGSYEDCPEIRPPSIRGQLHWWFRALGGTYDAEKTIFGGVHQGATASKLVVRVSDISGKTGECATLPHKSGGQASPKHAFLPGTTFTLHLLWRLGGVRAEEKALFDRARDAWLLAGSLGLRSTRCGGAFGWDGAPTDEDHYTKELNRICETTRLRFSILPVTFKTAEEARRNATDTISHQALVRQKFPLGAVKQGPSDTSNAPQRKTSPLRLTVRRFPDGFRLIAVWDGREEVTGNTIQDLKEAAQVMSRGGPLSQPKTIGTLLLDSTLCR